MAKITRESSILRVKSGPGLFVRDEAPKFQSVQPVGKPGAV